MISWAININGREPSGWDQRRDGCWFSDFDQQEFLLPFFDVGDAQIDPYGGTLFSTSDTVRLRDRLQSLRAQIEAKPEAWLITDSSALETRTIALRRDEILTTIDRTVLMCEIAIEQAGGLAFGGD